MPFGPKRVQKRAKSSDEFCLHGPGGFVCCLRKHFWNQNWWGTFQALIWHQLQWCRINLRCPLVQKGSKKRAESSDKLCLHGPGGFVCCLRKHFWNQNWWGTFQALMWHQLQWCSVNLRCPFVKKGAKKGPKRVTIGPFWPLLDQRAPQINPTSL